MLLRYLTTRLARCKRLCSSGWWWLDVFCILYVFYVLDIQCDWNYIFPIPFLKQRRLIRYSKCLFLWSIFLFNALISFKFQRIIFFASLRVNSHLFENPEILKSRDRCLTLYWFVSVVIFVYITCYPGEDAICIFVTKTKTETEKNCLFPFH